MTLKFTLKTKKIKKISQHRNFTSVLSVHECILLWLYNTVWEPEILALWRMNARPHRKGKQSSILLFISSGLYADESDPCALKIKKSIQFSRSLSYKTLKAYKTAMTATAYCLQNLVSELGVKNDRISFFSLNIYSLVRPVQLIMKEECTWFLGLCKRDLSKTLSCCCLLRISVSTMFCLSLIYMTSDRLK